MALISSQVNFQVVLLTLICLKTGKIQKDCVEKLNVDKMSINNGYDLSERYNGIPSLNIPQGMVYGIVSC